MARTELGSERAHAALAAMLSEPASTESHASDQMMAWASGFDKQMHRQAEIIRDLTDQRNTLAEKVDALARKIGDLGGTVEQTATRLDADIKAAQQTAVTALTAVKLAQAKAEQIEAAVIATPATAARPASREVPVHEVPPTRDASRELPALLPMPPLPPVHGAAPAAYTGTTGALPMPAEPNNGPPGMMKPFPVQAPPPATAEPAAPLVITRPNPPASAKPPPHVAPPFQAPMFQSNPLMTTGIFDAPVEPGAIAVDFAVDLGAAATVEAMRSRWNELKAGQSPLFDSLKPLVALKDGGKAGQELHLVAGPLASAAASARFCAVLSGAGIPCQATIYEGQHLAAR